MDEFNSLGWIPHIKALAKKFYEKADKRLVTHKELFIDTAIEEYANRRRKLKNEIFGEECHAEKRIDRHKTLALYIQVFLERPIFGVPDTVTSGENLLPETILINEMFCYNFMIIVLEKWTGKSADLSKLEEYKASFLKLLRYYRRYSKLYNTKHYRENSEFDKRNNFLAYIIAHVIYFIERDFMI
jgi:hypothetical protein